MILILLLLSTGAAASGPGGVWTLSGASNTSSSAEMNRTVELELQLETNRTSGLVTEDDERFQDPGGPPGGPGGPPCSRDLLVHLNRIHCGEPFLAKMAAAGAASWCRLGAVIRPYHELTECLEQVAEVVGCFFPNPDVQDLFLEVHSTFFSNCSRGEENPFEDAPLGLVVWLTAVPVGLIPALVYLVVWRS